MARTRFLARTGCAICRQQRISTSMARPLGTRKKPKSAGSLPSRNARATAFIFPTAALDTLGEIAHAQANTPGQTTWPNHLAKPPGQTTWPNHLAKINGQNKWPEQLGGKSYHGAALASRLRELPAEGRKRRLKWFGAAIDAAIFGPTNPNRRNAGSQFLETVKFTMGHRRRTESTSPLQPSKLTSRALPGGRR